MKLSLVKLDNKPAADKEFTRPRVGSGNIDVITWKVSRSI